eukprot:1160677-Pelagomonas_calceolata.AAC.2
MELRLLVALASPAGFESYYCSSCFLFLCALNLPSAEALLKIAMFSAPNKENAGGLLEAHQTLAMRIGLAFNSAPSGSNLPIDIDCQQCFLAN